jgi:sialate O-acetylesterase
MAYSLDGPGVFNPDHFPAWDGESIHCFGPSRHAGVPAIAGLIMHEEVRRGRIAHKLAFASCVNAFKEFVPPAIWGDGKLPGGIPEGAVLQLDPTLDLDRLRLSPAARTIARALQEYGMVNVDYGGGAAIYAEGLWGHSDRSWKGLLGERDLVGIPFEHFRLLKLPPITRKGFDIEAARRMTGEVWLACGQSNMEMTVQNSAEPAGSADPLLQLCQIPLRDSDSPCTDMQARWDVPAGGFSAVAYHFGRELRRTLNVPVTMISANLGATSIVSWMPREAVEADPHWAEIASRHTSSIAQYEWALKKRSEVADPKSVWLPPNPYVRRPSALYNGMIAPLRRLPIRGIIWYQGETDAAFPERYATLFPAMIRSWRQAFGRDLPIIFVQLSSFGGRPKEDWAPLREVQRVVAQTVPNTAMIVSLDVGDKDDIHPKRKQPVGERLARAARALVYGQPVAWRGPTLAGVDQDGRTLRFDNAGDGLRTDGQQLRGFEAAGADGEFHEVTAEIAGDTVIVTSPGEVRRIRYAWRSWTEANLFNSHGLPAEPFIKDVP